MVKNSIFLLLFLLILSCGITDNSPIKYPYIVIMFDDGRASVYDNAFPIMEKYGIVGTNAIVTKNVDSRNTQTWKQITELEHKYGWETASHTYDHPHLNLLSDNDFRFEMEKSLQDLKNHNLNPVSLAIPYGEITPQQYEIAGEYYQFVRNSNDIHTTLPINSKMIGCLTVHNYTKLSEIYDRIDFAQEANEPLLVILFHDVGNKNDNSYNYSLDKFEKLMKYISEHHLNTSTLRDAMKNLDYY